MNNNWISISEAVPETSGDYLVSCERENVRIDFFYGPDFELKRGWTEKWGYKVIAWQPLPQAYKEE